MKRQNKTAGRISRRQFLGTAAAGAAAFSIAPLHYRCTRTTRSRADALRDSNFGGVQIGTITYSFRGISGVEETLQACVDSGVSSIELMSTGIEQWAGAPELVRVPGRRRPQAAPGGMPQGAPGGARGGGPPGGMGFPGGQAQEMSEEDLAELEKKAAESQEALREWRLSAPMEKFEELRKMYNDAGINIHIVKFSPARWSDEETDYAFKAAKVMGAKGITDEIGEEACKRLGPIAEKHRMYAIFHNHFQFAGEGFSVDPFLEMSPANMLNFDAGHFFGSTGLHPNTIIEKYHDRIFSIHLKDKTGPNTDPPNENQVWGQGEMPIADVLLLIRKEKWPIHCDIELEYPVPAWSNPVKEVRTCVNYCRQILI
jgi:sugar phosphate isomerase/epimerase